MKCPWDSPNDIQRYLSGSVVRYEGHPYYVTFDGISTFSLYELTDQVNRKMSIKYDDPDLDVDSPELGYYMDGGRVLRLERQPQKQYSQGLTKNNTSVFTLDGKNYPSYKHPLLCQGVANMLLGVYPSLDEAFAILETKKEVALSRDVAMNSNGKGYPYTVFFKGETVGFVMPNTRKVVVPNTSKAWIVSRFLAEFTWEIE